MTVTILTYPDGDYQFVAPVVLRTGDIIRIHESYPGNLSMTSQPVTFISKPIQTGNLIIVETIPDSDEHQIALPDTVSVLRRIPSLPTEPGSYIFLDEYTSMHTTLRENTLAQRGSEDFWHFHDADMLGCMIAPDRITKWRPAYVSDKAPTA